MATKQRQTYNTIALEGGDPYTALAGAVLIRAVEEAREGDPQARAWLLEDGQIYLDNLGLEIDPAWLHGWVNHGCPAGGRVERPRLKRSAQFPGNNPGKRIVDGPRRGIVRL